MDLPLAEACTLCPIRRSNEIRHTQGGEEEAHYLRVQVTELAYKLARTRVALREAGVDPDSAYRIHTQDDHMRAITDEPAMVRYPPISGTPH